MFVLTLQLVLGPGTLHQREIANHIFYGDRRRIYVDRRKCPGLILSGGICQENTTHRSLSHAHQF